MAEFPFNGLLSPISFDQKRKRYTSNLKINSEWSLLCIWDHSHGPFMPQFLELHHNLTAKEISVSGNFELMGDGMLLHQQEFKHLIESGSSKTIKEIGLNLFSDYGNDHTKYSITGTLKIPTYSDTEYIKGVQFKSLLNLSDDFECLLDPNETCFSDVNVNCETVSFPAHKIILSARSPVFAAMFSTQMKESRNNKVDITDLNPQVLKTMLTYIYSGKTGDLSIKSAGELLFAADKYQLEDLKRVCSDFLKSYVSAENVLKTLVLGYLHDEDLKVFAIDFISNRCEDFEVLEKTVEWKKLREERPSLAMDVLTGLVKSKVQKLKGRK